MNRDDLTHAAILAVLVALWLPVSAFVMPHLVTSIPTWSANPSFHVSGAIAAFIFALMLRPLFSGRHFHTSVSCQRVVRAGVEEEARSFNGFHDNTLIGRSVGRLWIGIQSARFNRAEARREARKQ